jgi:hypothetical protein
MTPLGRSALGLCAALLGAFLLSACNTRPLSSSLKETTPAPIITEVFEPFTARFEITTNSTKRVFTDAKYHNQSLDVYIQPPDPSVVYVEMEGITWNDFFQTLPFSLTAECLVTGTKQTFCTNDSGTLRFYLNEVETLDALTKEIKANDFLKVEYGK